MPGASGAVRDLDKLLCSVVSPCGEGPEIDGLGGVAVAVAVTARGRLLLFAI
jgi:hypothetical protein